MSEPVSKIPSKGRATSRSRMRRIGRPLVVGVAAASLVGSGVVGAMVAVPAGAVAVAAGVSARVLADDTVLGTFTALGSGVNNPVAALATSGDDTVYVGGNFTNAPGVPGTNTIAAWSNADDTWQALGNGITGGPFAPNVRAIMVSGDDTVFVGGDFLDAGGDPNADCIVRWSYADDTWHALSTGVYGAVTGLALSGDDTVYAGGGFDNAGGDPGADKIAAWSSADDTWHALGTGMNDYVNAIVVDDTVYAGGEFTGASGVPGTRGVAAWSTADDTWHNLGAGVSGAGRVYALALSGDDTVYAGGDFTSASGVPRTRNIAAWSNADDTWHALGTGTDGNVYAVAVDDTHGLVYAGGSFSSAGAAVSYYVAVWDVGLGVWMTLQGPASRGYGTNSEVYALAVDDSVVYLGGDFVSTGSSPSAPGSVTANRVARWTWGAPSAMAVPASGSAGVAIDLEGSRLIGVTGVRVDGVPVPYSRDDSTTISLTLPGALSAGSHAITVDAVGGIATATYTVAGSPPPPPSPVVYPPGAPTGVTAVAGDASASVSWSAPADSGSYPITDYEVASSPAGGSCLVKVPSLSCTVSGLANGTAYTFQARALNGAGWGAWSSPSRAVTPTAAASASILVTGTREGNRVRVRGSTQGVTSSTVTPRYHFAGEVEYTTGVARPRIDATGEFTWSRVAGRTIYVYFAADGTRSNRLVLTRER